MLYVTTIIICNIDSGTSLSLSCLNRRSRWTVFMDHCVCRVVRVWSVASWRYSNNVQSSSINKSSIIIVVLKVLGQVPLCEGGGREKGWRAQLFFSRWPCERWVLLLSSAPRLYLLERLFYRYYVMTAVRTSQFSLPFKVCLIFAWHLLYCIELELFYQFPIFVERVDTPPLNATVWSIRYKTTYLPCSGRHVVRSAEVSKYIQT